MKITIRKPIGYSQIGRKDQQEDAVWPLFSDVSSESPCIVLCDGVGGSEHGEVASQTSSRVIGEYLTKVIKENQAVSEADLHEAVNLAYDELEKLDTDASEDRAVSMATTLTCVCLHKDGILAAHMGDSRIYHIRPGQGLLYQSADHSLVNTLLQAGELTLEEAKNFHRKNVITKAIQPHGKKRFKAEVQQLTDVQSGDYIFLCCDGVLEQLTNERLVEILSMNCSDKEKLTLLETESTDKTKDNYTAYLIPISKVKGVSSIEQDEEVATIVIDVATTAPTTTQQLSASIAQQGSVASQVQRHKQKPVSRMIQIKILKSIMFILMALLMFGIMFFWGGFFSKQSAENEDKDSNAEHLIEQNIKKNNETEPRLNIEENKISKSSKESDEPVTIPIVDINQAVQN